MIRFSIILILMLSSLAGVSQNVVEGIVFEVKEGDIILVALNDGDTLSAKINHIECPEIAQAFGNIAKAYTEKLCLKKSVTLSYSEYDRDRNVMADVLIKNQKDLGALLLEQGLAWNYVKGLSTHPNTSLYLSLEEKAKQKKKGLWKDPEQIPPWTFRNHQNKWEGKTSI